MQRCPGKRSGRQWTLQHPRRIVGALPPSRGRNRRQRSIRLTDLASGSCQATPPSPTSAHPTPPHSVLVPAAPWCSTPPPARRSSCWGPLEYMTEPMRSAEVRSARQCQLLHRQRARPHRPANCAPTRANHRPSSLPSPTPRVSHAAQTTSPNQDIFLVGGHTNAERYVSSKPPLGTGAGGRPVAQRPCSASDSAHRPCSRHLTPSNRSRYHLLPCSSGTTTTTRAR